MSVTKRAKYWVLHMGKALRAPTPVFPEELPPFSVQLLATNGGPTEKIGYVDFGDESLEIDGHEVPPAVLEKTKTLQVGDGAYLDEDGQEVEPF